MALFRFRLERLLGYRLSQEEKAVKELNLCKLHLEEVAAEALRLEDQATAAAGHWRRQAAGSVNLARLALTCEYYRVVSERLADQRDLERRSAQRVEEQLSAVRRSWRQRRALELLREKAKGEHGRQEKLRERRLIDEVTIYSYNRKNSS